MEEIKPQNYTILWIDITPGYFECFLIPSIALIGLIGNIICYDVFKRLAFSNKIKLEANLYMYLKIESFIISWNLFFQTFRIFFSIKAFQATLAYGIYTLYFLWIFPAVLELMAIICHTSSTIHYYLIVKEANSSIFCILKIFQASSFIYKTTVMVILSIVPFLYLFFCFEIGWIDSLDFKFSNETASIGFYAIIPKKFNDTFYKKIIEIISYLIRDFLMVSILLLMNILIYLHVRNALNNKKKLLYNSSASDNFNLDFTNVTVKKRKSKIDLANKRIVLMVVLTSLNNIFGRVPMLLYFILKNAYKENTILGEIGILAIYVSYSLNLFIFLLINSRFRRVLKQKYIYNFSIILCIRNQNN
jgi:hypothetical protein